MADSTKAENTEEPPEAVSVAVGEPFLLNCTYNCSSGFVRGCWSLAEQSGHAGTCLGTLTLGTTCTVTLGFARVSPADLGLVYVCSSEDTEHPELRRQTERRVSLQVQGAHVSVISHMMIYIIFHTFTERVRV